MKLTTKTEYSLICLKVIAERYRDGQLISASELAEKERMPKDYIEQLLLKLRKAGIVTSAKGVHGGYLLARHPSQISLREVIEALEGSVYDVYCEPEIRENIICTHFEARCSVRPIWMRLRDLLNDFFGSMTLETLLSSEEMIRLSFAGSGASDKKAIGVQG